MTTFLHANRKLGTRTRVIVMNDLFHIKFFNYEHLLDFLTGSFQELKNISDVLDKNF